MTDFKKKTSGPARLADVDAPHLPFGAVVDPNDHTLARAAWENGMVVTHPGATNGSATDKYNVQRAEGLDPDPNDDSLWENFPFHQDLPVTPGQALTFTLNKGDLTPDGPYALRVFYIPRFGDDWYSPATPITVDTTAPWEGNLPAALKVSTDQVTNASLAQGIEVVIPEYQWAGKDSIYLLWASYSDTPSFGVLDVFEVTGPTMTFTLPAEKVIERGSGHYLLSYRLDDKAGNTSEAAAAVQMFVALGDLASNLKPPRVPAADDGLINIGDARAGVSVYIDAFDHAQSADVIQLNWGKTALPRQPVAS